jgi:hypothetical protein
MTTQGGVRRIVPAVGALVAALFSCTGYGFWIPPALSPDAAAAALPSANPAWAKALGPGVVVVPPRGTPGGNSSPDAAVEGLITAINGPRPVRACAYYQPSFQKTCRANTSGAPPGSAGTYKDFALGYEVIKGGRALVGSTGTGCVPNAKPECSSNSNPAAVFSTRKSFTVLWAETLAAYKSSGNVYSLALCIKVGNSWYNYLPPN